MLSYARSNRTVVLAAALCALAACSDDDSGAADDKPVESSGPSYLVATAFYTGDEVETYLNTTKTFDKSTKLDTTSGVKLLGEIVPIVDNGKVYVTDEAEPTTIKRYELKSNGLEQTGDISFGSRGVTSIPSWFVYFVSSEKAYLFDQPGARILIWNPSTMKLSTKEIDLSKAHRDGWLTRLALESFSPQRRGSQLLIPTAWVGEDDQYRHATGVTILDTEADEVLNVAEDERCGEAYMTVKAPDGDIYFFPAAGSSAQHFFGEDKGHSCVLRLAPDADELDADFSLDLSEAGNGNAAASGVSDGKAGFYFGAADKDGFAAREDNGGAYWNVYHYDFETKKASKVDDMPTWPGTLYSVSVDGKLYLPYWSSNDDGDKTTVYQVGEKLDALFTFGASWGGFARLR